MKTLRGYTFIEVIIIVAIMATTIGLVIAWTLSSLDRAKLQASNEELISSMREVQSEARNGEDSSAHGVRLTSEGFTSFIGNSFDASAPSTRQTFTFPSSVHLTSIALNGGGIDLIFYANTGETAQYGNLILDTIPPLESFAISISPLGLIDWQ